MFLGICVHVFTGFDRGHPVLNSSRPWAPRSDVHGGLRFMTVHGPRSAVEVARSEIDAIKPAMAPLRVSQEKHAKMSRLEPS